MTDELVTNPIEVEIQRLLLAEPQLELVADHLIKKYTLEKMSKSELQIFSQFFLRCGFISSLCQFLVKQLERNHNEIPWGHFASSLFAAQNLLIQDSIKSALIEGAESQKQLGELARCHELDGFEPELINQRELRKQIFWNDQNQKKQKWLSEIETLKSQGLLVPEEELLEKMKRHFPNDSDVADLISNLRERKALGILHKEGPLRKAWIPLEIYENKDEITEKTLQAITDSMNRHLKKNPDLLTDFVVAQSTFENYAAALAMIEKVKPTSLSLRWIKIDLLLQSRKFLDVLFELDTLSRQLADDPEATFEILYLKAQSLWGLGQKFNAIEILESIATSRPQFRAATSLLADWKGESN